jgi:hypothetical protein
MNPRTLIATLALLWTALAAFPLPASGQDVTADVKTWAGQSWRLSQPSLEIFYSIVSKPQESGADTGSEAGKATNFTNLTLGGGLSREAADPSVATLKRLFGDDAPDTIQGHRQSQEITAYRGGVATQIPLGSIASIAFKRQPVRDSSLPPYLAATHIRYAADITLTDGGRIAADYVNLGSAILRGASVDGRIDIPWQDIEVLSFNR